MNAQSTFVIPAEHPIVHRLGIYWAEAYSELIQLLRNPTFILLTIVSPLLFYVILGLTFAKSVAFGDTLAPVYMLATYGTFGVVGISLSVVGSTIAADRAFGLLVIKRASPMPPEAMIVAKLVVGLILNTLYVLALFIVGFVVGGARLSAEQWLSLGAVLVAGTFPFATFGFAAGWMGKEGQGGGLASLIHLPLAFVSGLWIPLNQLPKIFKSIAPFLPQYHHAQLALQPIGASYGGSTLSHTAVLTGFSLVFLALAIRGYKRYQEAS